MPPEVVYLSNLEELQLGFNFLNNSIPEVIGDLHNLRILALNNNHLTGALPAKLGNLSQLQRLFLQANQLTGSIPEELGNLNLLSGGSDFRWNALYAESKQLRVVMTDKQMGGDWEGTQTVAPLDISLIALGPDTVQVTWSPIPYLEDEGFYEVCYSQQAQGPYLFYGITKSKFQTHMTISGLSPGTEYHFVLRSATLPHAANDNLIYSEASTEVVTTTPAVPTLGLVGWIFLLVGLSISFRFTRFRSRSFTCSKRDTDPCEQDSPPGPDIRKNRLTEKSNTTEVYLGRFS